MTSGENGCSTAPAAASRFSAAALLASYLDATQLLVSKHADVSASLYCFGRPLNLSRLAMNPVVELGSHQPG